jgi:hypothetical protein
MVQEEINIKPTDANGEPRSGARLNCRFRRDKNQDWQPRQRSQIREDQVELNIEKWPGIWQPAKGHTRLALRVLARNP